MTFASMPPPSDAELVAAAAGGDKQSFAVLLARHRHLALVTGAPIRVDSALLDDAAAAGRSQWQRYPISADRLVAEMRERFEEARAALAAEPPK